MYTIPKHENLIDTAYANIIHDAAYVIIKDEAIKKLLKKTKFFLQCTSGRSTYRITRNIIIDNIEDIPSNFQCLDGYTIFTQVSVQLRSEQITAKIKLLLP